MVAVRVSKGVTAKLTNMRIQDFKIGVQSDGGKLELENVSFKNVERPIVADDGSVRASRVSAEAFPEQSEPAGSGAVGGWTPPRGPRVPCHCPECGAIFPSRTFTIFNATFYSSQNTETCMVCRYPKANVAVGLFELSSDLIRLIAGDSVTLEHLQILQRVASSYATGKLTAAEAVKEVEAAHFGLGQILRKAYVLGATAVGSLVFAASAFNEVRDAYPDVKVFVGRFFETHIIEPAVKADDDDFSLSTLAPTTSAIPPARPDS